MKIKEQINEGCDLVATSLGLIDKNLISYIKNNIAKRLNLDESDYYNKSRRREIVTMKQLCAFFIRRYVKKISYAAIGQQFNNLHHATILHSIRKTNDLAAFDKDFKKLLDLIDAEINAYIITVTQQNNFNKIIDLNKLDMMSITDEKKIIFVGFSDVELNAYQEFFKIVEVKRFEKTGIYLEELENVEKK